jgi:hypothetical protein
MAETTKSSLSPEVSAELRRLGGIGIMIGNAALFLHALLDTLHGEKQGRNAALWKLLGAAMWSGGGVITTRYGKEPLENQFKRLQGKLTAHLELSGAKLDAAMREEFLEGKPRGIAQKLEAFAFNYPSETMAIYNTLAAGSFVYSGLKHHREKTAENGVAEAVMGSCIIASSLAAALIPEKTPEKLLREGQNPESLWGKIQQRPLVLANAISMGGNIASGWSAMQEIQAGYREGRDTAKGRHLLILGTISALATAFFVGSNILLGVSSKKSSGKPNEREGAQEKLIHAAATLLASQPPEIQENLAAAASYYLTRQPELRMMEIPQDVLKERILEAVKQTEVTPVRSGMSR